jgi:hypothetical protein
MRDLNYLERYLIAGDLTDQECLDIAAELERRAPDFWNGYPGGVPLTLGDKIAAVRQTLNWIMAMRKEAEGQN